jgi:hypothetical protein
MTWRLAESLERLRNQINAAYPSRSKASDGTIGDDDHASRASDHNPHVRDGGMGVVTALDITHDPESGCDASLIAEAIINSHDSRVKYLIWNRQMVSSYLARGYAAWQWRPYTGANPHTKHAHISVSDQKHLYDSVDDWQLP